MSHNSASGCPYSLQNLHKVRVLSDRLLTLKHESCEIEDDEPLEKQKIDKSDRLRSDRSETKMERSDRNASIEDRYIKTEKIERGEVKQEDAEFSDKNERSETSERLIIFSTNLFYSSNFFLIFLIL